MPSHAGFDEDVLQLLGTDFVPPKDVADMTAEDVAERVVSTPVRCPAQARVFLVLPPFHLSFKMLCSGAELLSRRFERQRNQWSSHRAVH